jgi:nicotinamide riboside kinase
MKVINLLGGPGTGKSTTCAGLFSIMKLEGYSVEMVPEFAKDLTWSERKLCLKDQFYVTANQNYAFERLRGKVDYVVTDTSLLLGLIYDQGRYRNFKPFLKEVYNSYDNINFFLRRKKKYDPTGRNQTEDEAKNLDLLILRMLSAENIPFVEINADLDAPETIFNIIK